MSSTPLDQLGNSSGSNGPPPADEERVRRILAEMNVDGVMQPPPVQTEASRVITEPAITTSPGSLRMDATTARANIIGNSQPTMADFHAMFQQASPGMAPFQPLPQEAGPVVPKAKASDVSWRNALFVAARGPLAVGIIIFLINLPVVTSILSRYASWMYLSSGEISIAGLLVKAFLAGGLFAAYQGVTMISG
jgi:hypothetical protein